MFFGVYGHTLKLLDSNKSKRKCNYLNIFIAGCVGGSAQLVFVVPADFIKTALQSQIPHDVDGFDKGVDFFVSADIYLFGFCYTFHH